MPVWLLEIGYILTRSPKSQFLLIAALVCGFGFGLLGEYMVSRIEFTGPLASIGEVVREKLQHRYDKAGVVLSIGFLVAAFRSYLQARRRLLGASR